MAEETKTTVETTEATETTQAPSVDELLAQLAQANAILEKRVRELEEKLNK